MQKKEESLPGIKRPWSPGEERANSISHAIGFLAAVAASPVLITTALRHGGLGNAAGACVFAMATVLLYLFSALHHGLPKGRAKTRFELLDHAAIYFLIAGTYTPFTLGVLWGPWGWTLFGVVWALAIAGVAVKMARGVGHPSFSIAIYVAMGWLIVVAAGPLCRRVPVPGLLLLLCGGLAYTGGIAFYVTRRIPYHHLLWHIFVMAGTICHYFAVLDYAWR